MDDTRATDHLRATIAQPPSCGAPTWTCTTESILANDPTAATSARQHSPGTATWWRTGRSIPFSCDYCSITFFRETQLTAHKRHHKGGDTVVLPPAEAGALPEALHCRFSSSHLHSGAGTKRAFAKPFLAEFRMRVGHGPRDSFFCPRYSLYIVKNVPFSSDTCAKMLGLFSGSGRHNIA